MHKISVVTINYNNAEGLNKTMQSVMHQTYKSFEYIVIDGNSTDNSRQVILDLEKVVDDEIHFKWLSEPDSGIYSAMNKGVEMSTGDYLLFLNSGDHFFDNSVLEACVDKLDNNYELYSGGLVLEGENKKVTLNPPKKLDLYQSVYQNLTHPSTFIKRSLFDKYGLYNEKNKIVSDWEFFFIVSGKNKCSYLPLEEKIAVFYEDGISSSNIELQEREKNHILKNELSETVILELEERHQLEVLINESWFVGMQRLKKNKTVYRLVVSTIRFLSKIIK